MENSILVLIQPGTIQQFVMFFEDNNMTDKKTISMKDLKKELFSMIKKYKCYNIHFAGPVQFNKGLAKEINTEAITKYNLGLKIKIIGDE